jgi:hypothetical protein
MRCVLTIRSIVLCAACATLAAACGHSEDEFRAAIESARRECATNATSASTTAVATSAGCGKDSDCKGDRVCELGRCTEPTR